MQIVIPDKRGTRRDDIDDDTIVRLYCELGIAANGIANLTGWPVNTIKYRLKRLGKFDHFLYRWHDRWEYRVPKDQLEDWIYGNKVQKDD